MSGGSGVSAIARSLKSSVAVSNVRFRPYEDVACAGHSHGLCTIVVPGSGEANFDSFEANPFMTLKQRREHEIQSLLGKLSYDMISLDTKLVGSVDKDPATLRQEQQELFHAANSNDRKQKVSVCQGPYLSIVMMINYSSRTR